MRRLLLCVLLSLAAPVPVLATDSYANASAVTDQQKLGMRLFNQSCRACHAENLAGVLPYGPLLWSGSVGGSEVAMRQIITEGTAHMPAWKYRFSPQEIAAIAAYVRTNPVKPQLSKESGMAAYGVARGEK